jgi:hypothetical protein
MGKVFIASLVILIGLLLLPPINALIEGIMTGLSMWIISVLVLVIGIKKLIMHFMKK